MQDSKLTLVVVGVLVIVVGVGIAIATFFPEASPSERTNKEIALSCTTDMATQFHIHPHLAIFIKDRPMEIPADIGVTALCLNALHTHDATGTIHVESPIKRDFTLGDFFAVWKKTLSDFGTTTSRMTVNGTANTLLLDYPMKDLDRIELYFD